MAGYKRLIEKYSLTEKLVHKIYLTVDEEQLFLNVEYDGRFKIEKVFKNNALGLNSLKKIQDSLDTEEKVLYYLGIGDKL